MSGIYTIGQAFYFRFVSFTFLLLALHPRVGVGQAKAITTVGVPVTENFNGLAATAATSSILPNGVFFSETGTSSAVNASYTINTGSGATADTYSFGSTLGATDRALGSISGGATFASVFGVAYTNNTGQTINQLTISYTGEQYRLGAANRPDRLECQYSTNAINLTNGSYIDVDQLDFNAPTAMGAIGALDGNAAANKTSKTYTITGLTIVNGGGVWLRFLDFNATGDNDGLAIDDLSVTAGLTPANADTAPPSFTAAFPAIGSIAVTSFSVLNSLSEAGTAYYIVLPDGAAAPTATQVKNAQTAINTPVAASFSGNIPVAAPNTTQTSQITGLTAATEYDVYVVAEDLVPNLQTTPLKLDVRTLALSAAPEINIQQAGADVLNGATYAGFSNTAVGGTDVRTFTIQNTGTLALNLTSQPPVILAGMGASQFAVTMQPAATIGAAGSSNYSVVFTPTSAGTKTARLIVNSNDADEAAYEILLSATALAVPTVTTAAVTTITATTAETGGNVIATGNATITARGVVYATAPGPRLGAAGVFNELASSGVGSYTSSLRNLTPGTTYYIAAYATNSAGTGYGTDQIATTQAVPAVPPLLGYDFANSDSPSIQAANVTGTVFSRVGVTAAAGTGRYNSNDWPTTTSVGLNRYVQFTFAPATGYQAELTSLSFVDQTSATGPVQYEIRSSLDNYARAIASGTVGGGLKTIILNNFSGLTTGVAFRFYAFASASNAGTYSVDEVNLYGAVAINTTPVLTTSATILSFTTQVNTTAAAQTYTLDGAMLGANSTVTITAPASFEVSVTSAAAGFASQQTATATATGTLTQQVWVRFLAGATPGTTASAPVLHDVNGARAEVEVTGTANPVPGLVRWDGGGDGASFADAQNWTTNVVPTTNDDVLLDHSVVASAYTIMLPSAASGTLSLGSFVINPGGGPSITAILPSTNTAGNYLRLTNSAAAFVLHSGATFINNSGSTTGGSVPVDVTASGPNFIIYNGGRYVHRTIRSATALIENLSAGAGTETGLFEFDTNSGSATISASGRTFGSLAFRATTTTAQSYVSSGGSALVVRGNLSIDANVTLTISLDASVRLSGNLINMGAFRFIPAGSSTQQLVFNGIASQTISGSALITPTSSTSSGLGANVDVVVDNPSGLTLATPLRVNGGLVLTSGIVATTAASVLTVAGSVSNTSGSFISGPLAREVATTGTVTFPIGKGGHYRPLTLTISTAPAGTTTYTAEQQEGAPADQVLTGTLTRVSRVRYYTVTPSPVPPANTFQGTIELSFGSNDGVTDPTDPTFVVAKSNGSGWSSISRSRNTATSLVSAPFTSFSSFALASTAGIANPLPVVLTSFSARRNSQSVELRWTTASETNNAAFEVQRSTNSRHFTTVATVAGQGQSSRPQHYATLDRNPVVGISYYRLRQLDIDGNENFSPVVTFTSEKELALYPVPAQTTITVVVPAPNTRYRILNTTGSVVLTGEVPGTTTVIDVASLPVGLYQLEVISSTGRIVRKFTKAD